MMPQLRALLVDDEAPARKQMRTLLAEYGEIAIAGEAESVEGALACLEKESFDVVFLDVQMPEACGFDLLSRLAAVPAIVFVTAHEQFAVRAFEANAVDYLLKPVHPARLKATVARLLERMAERQGQSKVSEGGGGSQGIDAILTGGKPPEVKRLHQSSEVMLRDGGRTRIIKVSEIVWIEAEGIYCCVQIAGDIQMLTLRSIGEWEELLPEEAFTRLDRSLIVNLQRITKVQAQGRNCTQLEFHEKSTALSIGRTASTKLRSVLRMAFS